MRGVGLAGLVSVALGLGGCSVATSTYNDATTTAGALVGSLGGSTAPDVAAPPPPAAAPSMGAFLEGPTGTRLGDADRQRAFEAEQEALASGDRKTWRGVKGNYGFVALSGSPTPDGCRDFTHTIYISGRPVTGKGTGCKAPDGTWRITG
jgi:surface antigen